MRGMTNPKIIKFNGIQFQLTRLMRGVTVMRFYMFINLTISTHTPHARRDFSGGSPYRPNDKFQLTRLMRGVTPHKI